MEEIEVPLEQVQEHIEHAAHHEHEHGSAGGHSNWITWSALMSAILAVLAAVASLNAGHHANEAMMDQIHASDQWSYYQAKGIKSSVLDTRLQILEAMGKETPEDAKAKLDKYSDDQAEIQEKAKELEAESAHHFSVHQVFAQSVTLFQIAIAVTAIALLTKRKRFLYVSLVFGLAGAAFLIKGFL